MTATRVPAAIMPWSLPLPDSAATSRSYLAALHRIYSFSERPRSPAELALGRHRKLDRVRELLRLLGAPHEAFYAILIAGTKGKGSMAAMLASILHEAGVGVGRFTQPHLYSFRERIWVDGDWITEAEVAESLAALWPAAEAIDARATELGPLTTFDVGVALCFLHFALRGVQLAVVEVGVGGRNDATNVVDPILSLIGPIGFDHVDVLGPTLADIARHKAGIMRPGRDVLVGRQPEEAQLALEQCAKSVGANLHGLGREILWEGSACEPSLVVRGPHMLFDELTCPLTGAFQRDNAALAVVGAALAGQKIGIDVTAEHVRAGLAGLSWPGRFQTVALEPRTIVDGAHNEAAARALRSCIADCEPDREVTLVLGMAVEKDVLAFLTELAPVITRVVATAARQRACDPTQLAAVAAGLQIPVEIVDHPGAALERAWELAGGQGVVVVTGSLFLVGDVLEWLLTRSRSI